MESKQQLLEKPQNNLHKAVSKLAVSVKLKVKRQVNEVKERILIIEDEENIARVLQLNLNLKDMK